MGREFLEKSMLMNYYNLASEGKSKWPTTHVMIAMVFFGHYYWEAGVATHESELPLLFADPRNLIPMKFAIDIY